jgi:magnesium transporter
VDPTPPIDAALSQEVTQHAPREAAELLADLDDARIARALEAVNPSIAQQILQEFDEARRQSIGAKAAPDRARQWNRNQAYPEGSLGRLMDPPVAVFRPQTTIAQAIRELRELVKRAMITYLFVTDDANRLVGVVVMRDMLLNEGPTTLDSIMIRSPFSLSPEMTLREAMKAVLNLHYPVYPVTGPAGELIGLVRGQSLFEAEAIEISAQAGTMVGVDKEERLSTPWQRSLRMRHPWLHLNLLTAFLAAGVVGLFQGTIDRIVLLAVFLPVLSGQSTNTGCQALAVSLRGITLGELMHGREKRLVLKEGLLGLFNGALVGVSAGIGMFLFASYQENPSAHVLGLVVFLAMTGSCIISGIFGAMIPLVLKRMGADPATASSIFLTTATETASMGLFLGLATLFVL